MLDFSAIDAKHSSAFLTEGCELHSIVAVFGSVLAAIIACLVVSSAVSSLGLQSNAQLYLSSPCSQRPFPQQGIISTCSHVPVMHLSWVHSL